MKSSVASDLVSIITPTFGRPRFLPVLWACVKAQTWPNIEWLVQGDSPAPDQFMLALGESKVRYFHSSFRQSIGHKRNLLIAAAKGTYIVHFDDDAYYSPQYVSKMISSMAEQDAAMCKLSSFFLFYRTFGVLAYWDLLQKTGLHFRSSETGLIPIAVTEANNAQLLQMHLGFGFSYVYKRAVWDKVKFNDINMQEDETFLVAATRASSPLLLLPDTEGICLHVLHRSNTSQCFPQNILPRFLVALLFPGAELSLTCERCL